MDVFRIRDRLISGYRNFTGSFVDIHDKGIADHVRERMARGYQWPDPWLSLNPNFASGGTITDLVAEGLLHPECEAGMTQPALSRLGHGGGLPTIAVLGRIADALHVTLNVSFARSSA